MLWPLAAATVCLRNETFRNYYADTKRAWLRSLLVFLRHSMSLAKAQALLDQYF